MMCVFFIIILCWLFSGPEGSKNAKSGFPPLQVSSKTNSHAHQSSYDVCHNLFMVISMWACSIDV